MGRRADARLAVLAAALSVSAAFQGAGPTCLRADDRRRTALACSERAPLSRAFSEQQHVHGTQRARGSCVSSLFAHAGHSRAGSAATSPETRQRRGDGDALSPAPVATPKTSKWIVIKKEQQYNVSATAANIITRARTKSGVQREFNNEISRLGKDGQWQEALLMLEEMEKAGFKATVVSYNAAMSALNKNGQSEQALDLFDRVFAGAHSDGQAKMKADSFSYATALSACVQMRRWQRVFALFERMEDAGIKANAYHYSSLMTACERSEQPARAQEVFEQMQERGMHAGACVCVYVCVYVYVYVYAKGL